MSAEGDVVLARIVIERRLTEDGGDVLSIVTSNETGEDLTRLDALALLTRSQFFVMGV